MPSSSTFSWKVHASQLFRRSEAAQGRLDSSLILSWRGDSALVQSNSTLEGPVPRHYMCHIPHQILVMVSWWMSHLLLYHYFSSVWANTNWLSQGWGDFSDEQRQRLRYWAMMESLHHHLVYLLDFLCFGPCAFLEKLGYSVMQWRICLLFPYQQNFADCSSCCAP